MDLNAYDLAAQLRDALADALALTRAGAPDFAVVHPGNTVPQYGCGVAAVRVVSILPGPTKSPTCPPEWQITYEMSMDRCYATPADNAMPPVGVLDSATRDALEDAGAMRKAAVCGWAAHVRRTYGAWAARGPNGGIHGGTMQVTALGIGLACGCDDGSWGAGIDERIPMLTGDPRTVG